MRYKRKEPFRYLFNEPMDGKFVIILNHEDEDKVTRTDPGMLKIIDLSPRGMQFRTKLDIPTSKKEFYIEVTFELDGEMIEMLGKVAWKKNQPDCVHYGLEGIEDPKREQQIIEGVKSLSKKAHAKANILEKTEDLKQVEASEDKQTNQEDSDEQGKDTEASK
ncbi:MAG: PilZ domain-containing protein [Bacillota bacterium]